MRTDNWSARPVGTFLSHEAIRLHDLRRNLTEKGTGSKSRFGYPRPDMAFDQCGCGQTQPSAYLPRTKLTSPGTMAWPVDSSASSSYYYRRIPRFKSAPF
jgi:hypothetical protein